MAWHRTRSTSSSAPTSLGYVHHADRRDERLLDTRFVTAQLLAAEGLLDEARAELQVLRPAFEERYGRGSVHVRNLERQVDRLRQPGIS